MVARSVTVSYFEWAQNVHKLFWTEDDVSQCLDQKEHALPLMALS